MKPIMKAIPMTINGMMVSQIINFSLSIISPTLLDEIHSSSSIAKMPFLVIFSQRRRPNNPVVKIRIKPVIPSMSARWYLVNSCRPTIARNIPIPAPVVLLELDITNLGCPFMTLAFCRHHLPYQLWCGNNKGVHYFMRASMGPLRKQCGGCARESRM